MKNIHNQNKAKLAHCIIVFSTQELRTCFGDTGILVYHLFFLGLLKPSLLHLIKNHVRNRVILLFRVCLMEWPAKDILIPFKPLVFEKRMDLVLSSAK